MTIGSVFINVKIYGKQKYKFRISILMKKGFKIKFLK